MEIFLPALQIMVDFVESQTPRALPENISLSSLKSEVLASSKIDSPQILKEDPKEIDKVLDRLVTMNDDFENLANPHPPVYKDTDVVVVLSGPGAYSLSFPPYEEKQDRYRHLPWSRKMERSRVRVGVTLVVEITAKKLGKNAKDVTCEDIGKYGPWFHYGGTEWEINHIRKVLEQGVVKIPPEKIYMYDDLENAGGSRRKIINTADQMRGLRFPVTPRRIAIVTHAPHLVRTMYMLGNVPERIPQGTVVEPFPIPTPKAGRAEYAQMELQGTLAAIYKLKTASKEPFPYRF